MEVGGGIWFVSCLYYVTFCLFDVKITFEWGCDVLGPAVHIWPRRRKENIIFFCDGLAFLAILCLWSFCLLCLWWWNINRYIDDLVLQKAPFFWPAMGQEPNPQTRSVYKTVIFAHLCVKPPSPTRSYRLPLTTIYVYIKYTDACRVKENQWLHPCSMLLFTCSSVCRRRRSVLLNISTAISRGKITAEAN